MSPRRCQSCGRTFKPIRANHRYCLSCYRALSAGVTPEIQEQHGCLFELIAVVGQLLGELLGKVIGFALLGLGALLLLWLLSLLMG